MATKFKEYYDRMIEENKEAFSQFTRTHFEYSADQEKFQDKFNKEGEKILNIVQEWENKLCSQSEKAGYGNYTGGLSEKFRQEVRSHFPLIDHVGIIVKPPFSLKKIKLN